MYAEIILAKPVGGIDKTFDYLVPQELGSAIAIGSKVLIPFGPTQRIGYVIKLKETSNIKSIKPINKLVSDLPAFTENGLKLARWISEYYFSFFTTALRAILPPGVKNKRGHYAKRNP